MDNGGLETKRQAIESLATAIVDLKDKALKECTMGWLEAIQNDIENNYIAEQDIVKAYTARIGRRAHWYKYSLQHGNGLAEAVRQAYEAYTLWGHRELDYILNALMCKVDDFLSSVEEEVIDAMDSKTKEVLDSGE